MVPDGRASHHGRSALGEQAQSALIVMLVPVVAAKEALLARACHESDCAMQVSGNEGPAKTRSGDWDAELAISGQGKESPSEEEFATERRTTASDELSEALVEKLYMPERTTNTRACSIWPSFFMRRSLL